VGLGDEVLDFGAELELAMPGGSGAGQPYRERSSPTAERLLDEVEWLRDCASWLAQLELGEYPPAKRRMSSRRSAGAAGRPTHTRSTAAATLP
jgi:hypothetical protein